MLTLPTQRLSPKKFKDSIKIAAQVQWVVDPVVLETADQAVVAPPAWGAEAGEQAASLKVGSKTRTLLAEASAPAKTEWPKKPTNSHRLLEESISPPPLESKTVSERTFDGKTGDEWIEVIKTEINPDQVRQALAAVTRLCKYDSSLVQPTFDAVLPHIRMGAQILKPERIRPMRRPDYRPQRTFRDFFQLMPSEDFVKLLETEIDRNETRSFEFFELMLKGDLMPFPELLRNKCNDLVERILRRPVSAKSLQFATKLLRNFDVMDDKNGVPQPNVPRDSLVTKFEIIAKNMSRQNTAKRECVELATLVVGRRGSSRLFESLVAESLLNGEQQLRQGSSEQVRETYLTAMPNLKMAQHPEILEFLKVVFEDDKKLRRIYSSLNSEQRQRLIEFMTALDDETSTTYWDTAVGHDASVQVLLLTDLHKRGADGVDAIPWLNSLSDRLKSELPEKNGNPGEIDRRIRANRLLIALIESVKKDIQ